MTLSLGVIGMSNGNGHPYSWSAIFNGYNPIAMEECGFPVIPRYLESHCFPDEAITEAKVTHVWAQTPKLAAQIAEAALIGKVVDQITDMLGEIDGLLLARDDAETHEEFAAPFLKAGIPVYIDKPLALSQKEALRIIDLQRYPGQLFSCSALRYADELKLSECECTRIGRIRYVDATVPKDWEKYAIHAIDPILNMVGYRGKLVGTRVATHGGIVGLDAIYEDDLHVRVASLGELPSPIAIKVFGELGWVELIFKDTFQAFKAALGDFVQGIIHHDIRTSKGSMLAAIQLVEAGCKR